MNVCLVGEGFRQQTRVSRAFLTTTNTEHTSCGGLSMSKSHSAVNSYPAADVHDSGF